MNKPRKLRGRKPQEVKPKKAKILIFGDAGVGKTWTAIEFPDVYYIDVEGGATRDQYTEKLKKSGAIVFGPDDGSTEFGPVLDEIQTLATCEHDRKTLVIDSYTKLFNTSIALEEERLSSAGEKIAFGNEKKPAVKMSRRLITWIDKLDMNVVLICHEKAKWAGGEQIGYTFDGWDKINYELDLTLRIVRLGGSRKAEVCKSRHEGFPDGSNFDWNFKEFSKRYGSKDIDGKVVKIEVANDQQVQQMRNFLDVGLLDSGTASKWLEKAGVDDWSGMDSVSIQKCIDALKSKVGA